MKYEISNMKINKISIIQYNEKLYEPWDKSYD